MKTINKMKVAIIAIIFFIGIAIATNSSAAFEIFDGDEQLVDHRFKPHSINGEGVFYCIQGHGSFNATLSRSRLGRYNVGSTYGDFCSKCGGSDPFGGSTYSTIIYNQGSKYDERAYQDVAYILKHGGDSMDAQFALWTTSINQGAMEGDNALSLEGKAYKNFYNSIHLNYVDVYQQLIKDNTRKADVKVTVNKNDDSYTAGPFNVSYPSGSYNNINKWSWIQAIQLLDQKNNVISGIQILSTTGALLYDTDKDGNLRNVPLNGQDFYVKFKTNGTVTDVYLNVDFGYLESHTAALYQYDGQYYNWYWSKQGTGGAHHHGCHTYKKQNGGTGTCHHTYSAYEYVLRKTAAGSAQVLMALKGDVTENYKAASIKIPFGTTTQEPGSGSPGTPSQNKVDITMNLSGTVFLDKDSGKVNEGNNKLDGGEGLKDVVVTLYDYNTKAIVVNRETGKNYITLTDSNGKYEFTRLDAQKDYYVKFTYNGMLYSNVAYNYYGDDTSKATEGSQGNGSNRSNFNSLFSEIRSYPENYKIRNKIFGNDLGDYNRTYFQEDIADVFRQVSQKIVELNGDENAAYRAVAGSSEEMKRKVQFVADCRINAYTEKTYTMPNEFIIRNFTAYVAGKTYPPIYSGVYNQTNVNLGIKNRSTFDAALYKDVFNAVLNINGKDETYTYDARKDVSGDGFGVGITEQDYLNQLYSKYVSNQNTSLPTKSLIDAGSYTQEFRSEEIINGNNSNTNINEGALYNENKNYSWRDINYGIAEQDKLQIHITYKIAIRNQSNVTGSITEVVDYYDNNYQFETAYVGDKNGNKIDRTSVENAESSMYGGSTQYGTDGKYKTIYLRPTEQQLTSSSKEQYIYITFGVINPEQTLVNAKLFEGQKLHTYNLAEINGYRTYGEGLVDKDSNPGNFTPSNYEIGKTELEDDESQAPAFIYSLRNSRTLEGTVFEDTITSFGNSSKLTSKESRFGNGSIDSTDTQIKDVKVELVELKDTNSDGQKEMYVRSTTYTDEKGWYGFGTFLPGDYVVRYTYGAEDGTAMTTTTPDRTGSNETSYNGQDYQSTTFNTKQTEITTTQNYKVDNILENKYNTDNSNKNSEENNVNVTDQKITKYENNKYYWYSDREIWDKSDASDDLARRDQVVAYSKSEYNREITNHKAEVFNSYLTTQPEHITSDVHKQEIDELERRTYRYAYTAEMPIEVEYIVKQIGGNQSSENYTYKITGVDFGVVERPRSELVIDQDVANIKVTAADGVTVLFDTAEGVNNLQWVKGQNANSNMIYGKNISDYDKKELINIIMDDELISGAKLEITYKLTVTNNGEKDADVTTRAKSILDYVANNLNFEVEDNKDANGNALWKVVTKDEVQNAYKSTFVNNTSGKNNLKLLDLSTQTTILQTTDTNPLAKTSLKPGEQVSSTLVLKKVLSAESSSDDLTYANMSEIVEIDNTVGRYDRGAVPGNQSVEVQPQEHDTAGASKYTSIDNNGNVNRDYPQDGTVIITPPTGSKQIYYIIGITATLILAIGIYLIKRFIIDRK